MLLTKLTTQNAEKLANTLGPLSPDTETSGYLLGLLQDVSRCVEVNLKNRPNKDGGDVCLINEVLDSLSEAKTNLSLILTADIRKATT